MLAALEANPIGAIKIGMLATAETVAAVAAIVADHPGIPVVLDPVIASSSGTLLLEENGICLLLEVLLPLCNIVTPNLPELRLLCGIDGESHDRLDPAAMSETLLSRGARAVLAKGGHIQSLDCADMLYRTNHGPRVFAGRRFVGTVRGTGCMLASGIAAGLASGQALEKSIHDARQYIEQQFLQSGHS